VVVFYISGHGFGHASRQIEIINALGTARPDTAIVVRTSAPRWIFDRTVRVPFTFLERVVDTGVVQVDSLRLDAAATMTRARYFYSTFHARVAEEADLLRERAAKLVVSDAPPLGCAAAAVAGISSVVCSNFTWDWIYSAYEEAGQAPEVISAIQTGYRCATAGWRLPMYGGFETISPLADVPLVARHATRGRAETRAALDLPADLPLVLSSFGGYGIQGLAIDRLDCLDTWTVALTGVDPPAALPRGVVFIDERRIYAAGLRYEDLVAASDVVATKPGYGIISECVANGAAMLYTSRGRFAEYDVLVREMPRWLRCRFIELDDLLAGRWRSALDALRSAAPPPERARTDGAQVVAGMIGELVNTN
jgi:L-arabinokinase